MSKFARRKSSNIARTAVYHAEALERRTLLSTIFINGDSSSENFYVTVEGATSASAAMATSAACSAPPASRR